MTKSETPASGLTALFSEPIYKFIREIGFPIAVCLLMFWFIWQGQQFQYELFRTEQAERKEQRLVLEKVSETLLKLVDKVERLDNKK